MTASGYMQKRNIPRSSLPPALRPARLELRPDRAFVVHLDVRAQPPRRVVGRVEHVTSGQVARVELMGFIAKCCATRSVPSEEPRAQLEGGPAA